MAGAGHGDEACQTADGAGDSHGADGDLLHVDAGVPGGVLTVAHHGDLISLLGIFQVQEHPHRQQQHQDNIQAVFLAEQLREPAVLGPLVDDAHGIGAHGIFPQGHKVAGELDGHVVHHQGEQRFIGVPHSLEGGGHHAPRRTSQQADHRHDDQQQGGGDIAAEGPHKPGGDDAADEDLSLGADVPEAHLEGGGQPHADAQQHHGVPDSNPAAPGGAEGAVKDALVHLEGVQLGDGEDEDAAHDQGQQHRDDPDGPCLGAGDAVPLGDAEQRLPVGLTLCHASFASFTKRVISRPTSSLVVVRPSTIPLTWPPQSTRIRSHSSSSTSRSSPT